MKSFKRIVLVLLVVLVLVAVFQNFDTVETRFLFAKLSMPLAALIASTLAVGVVIGILLSMLAGGGGKPR